jgi:tRNA (cytosine49-C5)-methyltransferase
MSRNTPEQIPSAGNLLVKQKFEERYRELLKERYDEFMGSSTSYARKSIRANTIKMPVIEVCKRLDRNWRLEQVPWCPEGFWIDHRGVDDEKRYDIGNTPEHILGYIYVQDAASMIPPVVLNPVPGDTVLDMCASPGSKTSQMAAMMQNSGCIIANELQGDRLKSLGINLQRTGAINTIITQLPGHRLKEKSIMFDKVLVDAPCSGTGTIRKSFLNLKMWSPNLVKKLASQQKQLLQAGFDVLKPGGTIVYSTCTMEPEENEGVVSAILENNEDAEMLDIHLPIKRSSPISQFGEIEYSKEVNKCLRIWPQDNDTEGFFIAKISKKG